MRLEEWEIIVPEARPDLSTGIEGAKKFRDLGYQVAIITDNMIGYFLQQKKVKEVHLFFQRKEPGKILARTGSFMTSILARENNIPCFWHQVLSFPSSQSDLRIAGEEIVPKGVNTFYPLIEEVPSGEVMNF